MAEQKQGASSTLPKNIRQIGTSTGSTRVYLEDYVYTYLHMQEEVAEWAHKGFVLLGKLKRDKDFTRYFISGMICIKDEFFKDDILEFHDGTWAYIYQEMKKYYEDLEIVGWGQDVSGASASLTAELERNHKQNFNIQKNVLFLLDQVENEEAFYIYDKSILQRREGYYVYYEKNPQMQEYMVENRKKRELNIPVEEIQEPFVHSYRETLLDKKSQLASRKWNGILYTTSMLLVLSVCVLGVSTVNNVEKMQDLETTIDQISSQAGQADEIRPDGSGAAPVMSSDVQQTTVDDKAIERTSTDDLEKISSDKDHPNATVSDTEADGQEDDLEDPGVSAGQAPGQESDEEDQETIALTEAQTYLLQGYYIVEKGDSLVGISKKIYGTPKKAKKIRELNGIEDMDKIYAGQRLELP